MPPKPLSRLPIATAALFLLIAILPACRRASLITEEERTHAFDLLTEAQDLKEKGDLLLARDLLLKAIEASPRPVLFYEVANCYHALGEPSQALAWYQRAQEAAPAQFPLAEAEQRLVAAQMQSRGEEPLPPLASEARPSEARISEARISEARTATPAPTASTDAGTTPADSATAQAQQPGAPPQEPSREGGTDRPGGFFGGLTGALAPSTPQDGQTPPPDPELVRQVIFPELEEYETLTALELADEGARAASQGRFDEAVRLYERALRRTPETAELRLALGRALTRTGRSQRAEAELLRAERLAPESAEIAFELGNFYVAQGEAQAAIQWYDQALRLDSEFLEARNNRGVIYLEMQDFAAAAADFEGVLDQNPEFAEALINLALARDGAGAPAAQIAPLLERYVRLVPLPAPRTENWLREMRREAAAQAAGTP